MSKFISFETRFNYGARKPDEFNSELGIAPDDSFVVAYDRDGFPISRYGDYIWDLSAYQKNKPSLKLNFISWIKGEKKEEHIRIANEIKWILFLYWYFWKTINSVNSLISTLSSLRSLAKYCYNNDTTPIKILNDPIEFASYLEEASGSHSNILSSLITALINMGEVKRGFPLLFGTSLKKLNEIARAEKANTKQYPVIPTRIYSELISNTIDEIEYFEAVSDSFLQLIKDCSENPLLGRTYIRQRNILKEQRKTSAHLSFRYFPEFSELIDQYELRNYIESYSRRTGKEIKSVENLAFHIKEKQSICFLLITLFSGMRHGETNRLPYDCLETFYENGKKHYRLCGETFKLHNNISTRAKWVTDPIVERAINISQKIAHIIYSTIGITLSAKQRINADYPLFIGVGYLPVSGKTDRVSNKAPYSNSTGLGTLETLPTNLFLVITEEDISELESIDPFRNWRSEHRFSIGLHWPYSPHQARRSLAVYAAASGQVSLPSLKQQLQQITNEMAIYYSKGSAYAKKLIAKGGEHFYHVYQAAQPEAQALAYIAQVLLSDEPLFGGHGAWISQRFKKQETLSVEDRKITMQRFKKGEITYKSTPLGGCTTVEPCNKKPLRTVTACLDCAKAIIKISNITKVIKKTAAQLSRLDPQSVEAEIKKSDLSELVAFKDRLDAKVGIKQ